MQFIQTVAGSVLEHQKEAGGIGTNENPFGLYEVFSIIDKKVSNKLEKETNNDQYQYIIDFTRSIEKLNKPKNKNNFTFLCNYCKNDQFMKTAVDQYIKFLFKEKNKPGTLILSSQKLEKTISKKLKKELSNDQSIFIFDLLKAFYKAKPF